ncbi:PREDICTED: uncharacterized protein LOC109338273 [Lupinus angustifolius]|uniref:uncharacterized protein LOC109338273 n=1 Tax=Lupinus angustifolius TaxID=3871 RepID=UPI00092FB929|nr:PREDICTED: uncharacterized protein LOC109338273 [Lupinus angustifolius]
MKFRQIVDCVDINKQPAFDHPLLKNHKLQYATLYTKKSNDKSYNGVNGHIEIYNPRLRRHQMSLAQIAVENGEGDGLNTITFGWQVAQELYTRKTTHLFALWTSDSFKSGCYNMLCQGFVQIDKSIFLGIRINPVSSYGGIPYELSFSISQDPNSKNWWLIVNDIQVGYYPAELFSNMIIADKVGWGGKVSGIMKGLSPPMGSGYFPDGDLTHACFIRQISYNVNGSIQEPNQDLLDISVDNPNCYNLTYLGFLDNDNRNTFQFGGPGGQC